MTLLATFTFLAFHNLDIEDSLHFASTKGENFAARSCFSSGVNKIETSDSMP
ncbi:uncharacterized protein RSE6_13942 [Rhynchosporium secalis]|uniref:Uncharacterized protein n=1 Tax=Rhynchosporium secalis TaxID=38038 RepID=A0A1E1MU48_RHYSE|nr:uncharacterized protein RSE6_13942 [Rhynchosporium secalis]